MSRSQSSEVSVMDIQRRHATGYPSSATIRISRPGFQDTWRLCWTISCSLMHLWHLTSAPF